MSNPHSLLHRVAQLTRHAAAFGLLAVLPSLALATGCRLEFVETSPIALSPGTSGSLSLRAVDAGAGACTAAGFVVSVVTDTTAGTQIAPLTGSLIGNSAPQLLNLIAPPVGGGSVTWQATCATGCEAAAPPNPQFTVNILGGTRELQLLPGTPTEVPPGSPLPVDVRVIDSGVPVAGVSVNWQTVSGNGSVAQPSSTSIPSGLASNTLTAAPGPGLSLFRATRGDDPMVNVDIPLEAVVYSLTPGNPPTSVAPGETVLLEARLFRQGTTLSSPPGAPVFWEPVSGPAAVDIVPQNNGLTDTGGIARASFQAPLPGTYVLEAVFFPGPPFPITVQAFTLNVAGASAASIEVVDAPRELYSDETSQSGIEVQLLGSAANGQPTPLADAEVSFYISSGNASFSNGFGLVIERTDSEGRVRTPTLSAGRSTTPIVVQIASPGLAPAEAVVSVLPSAYRIEALPLSAPARVGETSELVARLWRRGSGAEVSVAAGRVDWRASGGRLAAPSSTSGSDGRADNRYTPEIPGRYEVIARFEPGQGLVASEARFRLEVAGGQLRLVSGDSQRAPAGASLPVPIVLQALHDGQPQSGIAVRLASVQPGLATVEPEQAVTGSDGRASFNVRLSPNAQGEIALRATRADSGASVALSARVGATAQIRRLEVLSGSGQSGVGGATLAQPLLLAALDDERATSGIRVDFSVQPEGAAELSPDSGLTGSDGRLATTVRLSPSAAGTVRVLARRSDTPEAVAEFILFAAVGGESSLQIEAGDLQTGVRGGSGSALVVRHTRNGLPVQGATVQWQTIEGGARPAQASSQTDAEGRARVDLQFGEAAGGSRIRALIDQDLEVFFRVTTVEGQLLALSGNNQSAAAGSALAQPLVVRIQPAAAGIPVQWRVLSGGGSLQQTETATDANGEARSGWTLGPQAGAQSVGVRLGGGAELVFSAQAGVIAGSRIEIVSGNGQSLPPGVDSTPLLVRVLSASGAPVSGQRVRWSSERAALDAEERLTDSEGRASVRARVALPGAARVFAQIEGSEARVEFSLNAGLAQLGALDPRQREIANVLDSACSALSALPNPNAAQRDLLARCGDLSDQAGADPAQVGRALSQLPNDVGLSLARAGDEAMRGQIGNLDQRQRALRGGQRMQVAFGLTTPDGSLPLSALPALAAMVDGEALGDEVGSDFERWGAFVNGSFGRGRSRGAGLNPAFDYDLGSLTAGVDYRFSDRFVAGAALGINRDSTEFAAGRGDLESRGNVLSAYASVWLPKDAYLDANLSYGRNRFDLSRRLRFSLGSVSVDQRAEADTDATLLGGSLALGRDWQVRSWNLGAYLRGQFSRVEYDAFEERMIGGRAGEGLGLRVESPRWNSLEGVLGGRASRAYSFDWGVLLPNLMLEYSREFRDDPSRLDASFLADPTGGVFSQSGAPIDQSHVNFGLGMSAVFPGGRSGFLQYERRLQDDRISHWLLSIGGRWEF